jgi:hypothetical protein
VTFALAIVGRIMKSAASPVDAPWGSLDPEGSHPDPRLCSNARGCDDSIRKELAAGIRALIRVMLVKKNNNSALVFSG